MQFPLLVSAACLHAISGREREYSRLLQTICYSLTTIGQNSANRVYTQFLCCLVMLLSVDVTSIDVLGFSELMDIHLKVLHKLIVASCSSPVYCLLHAISGRERDYGRLSQTICQNNGANRVFMFYTYTFFVAQSRLFQEMSFLLTCLVFQTSFPLFTCYFQSIYFSNSQKNGV